MINEIMLASVLATSVPAYTFSNFFSYNSVYLDVSNLEVFDNDYLILNLSNGVFYQAHLAINENETYTEYNVVDMVSLNTPYNINVSEYFTYLYNSNTDRVINYGENSYIDIPIKFQINNLPLSITDNSEANLDYFLALSDNRLNSFLKTADGYNINLNDFSLSNVNFNQYYYNGFLGFSNILDGTFDSNLDYYVIFKFNETYLDSSNYVSLDFYWNLSNIEIYLEDNFGNGVSYNGDFNDFIYGSINNYIDDLTSENELLKEKNIELVNENNELNSRHVLTNVFEIVRGAFEGVVNFFEIELMPNLTIGTIIFIPVVIGVIFFILKALVL